MRTLRGRVSLLALFVIAAWLVVLTLAFNLFLRHRLTSESESALRVQAQAASATVVLGPAGRATVRDPANDSDLDAGTWIYDATGRALERPKADARLQHFADTHGRASEQFAELDDAARLYVLPVTGSGERIATVVTASTTSAEHRAEKIALAGSALVSALVLGVAYLVVRFALRRALAPVDAMARQAAQWSAHETRRRFGTGQRYQELRALAADLDGLLDRLSAVLRHEQQLSGELSHELRTPLARITAEADLLVSSGNPADRDAHRSIADAARTMDEIIDTLLETARAESSAPAGTCRVADVIAGLGADAEIDDEVAAGVDAAVLTRIVAPLLDNAHRYAQSRVWVTARRDGGAVLVDVCDDGPALSAELAERVFEPGFRGNPADGHGGAGLGLALARRLARASDGDVVVRPGEPMTFRVTLPAG